jgi:16S rRNA (uracil1498-N3)-methyltransferase
MRIPRIHVPQPLAPGRDIELPQQASEHIARVLRLDRGHPLRLFSGDGNEYSAEIVSLGKRSVSARVIAALPAADRESPLRITLGQGIARGEKMDLILQKATELGVVGIVPLVTVRTEVKLDADRAQRRMAHWRAVIASACEQSGRTRLPEIREPVRLADWAATLGNDTSLRLTLDPHAAVAPRDVSPDGRVTLAIGPEGGLSEQDLATLKHAGFSGLRLGPRILRTETAGLAAIAALQAIHGDM